MRRLQHNFRLIRVQMHHIGAAFLFQFFGEMIVSYSRQLRRLLDSQKRVRCKLARTLQCKSYRAVSRVKNCRLEFTCIQRQPQPQWSEIKPAAKRVKRGHRDHLVLAGNIPAKSNLAQCRIIHRVTCRVHSMAKKTRAIVARVRAEGKFIPKGMDAAEANPSSSMLLSSPIVPPYLASLARAGYARRSPPACVDHIPLRRHDRFAAAQTKARKWK
jgi:hypothetical protein